MIAQSQSVPAGYKQTDVGVIPNDWDVRHLDSLVAYTNGKAHEGHISDFGKYVVVNSKFISTSGGVRKYSDCCFSGASTGDILMVMSDVPNGRAIARCFYIREDDVYAVNQRICALKPCDVDGRFLFYKLDRHPYYLSFDDGVKQTNLRKDDVLSCPIAVPATLAEQEAIAEALGDADALIESLEQLVNKKRHLKQAAMQQLLTGKKRLPGFEGEWAVVLANEVGSFRGGVGFPLRVQGQASGEFPFFKVSDMSTPGNEWWLNVANNYVDDPIRRQLGAPIIPANSIVFAKVGGAIFLERKRLLAHPSCLDNNMSAFVPNPDRVDHRFMHYVFLSINLGDLVSTTALPALSSSVLGSIPFLLPDTPEQTAIAEVLTDMDTEIEAIEAKLAKARQIKQGMMQELLTGRIRLV